MMSERNKKVTKRNQTRAESDLMMNRLMLMFVIATLAVTVVMCLRNANRELAMISTVGPVMTVVCLVIAAACAAFFAFRKSKKVDDASRTFNKFNVLGIGVISLICACFYFVNPSYASIYCVAFIIGGTALYYIRYIYPTEFFAMSCLAFLEGVMFHIGYSYLSYSTLYAGVQYACRAGAIVLPVLAVIGALIAKKKAPKAKILPLILMAVITLAAAVVMIVGVTMNLFFPRSYAILVTAVVYIALGLVQTVKMI